MDKFPTSWINFLLHEEFNKFLGNAYIKLMSEATLGRRYLYLTVLVYISVESQYIFFHIIRVTLPSFVLEKYFLHGINNITFVLQYCYYRLFSKK